MLQLSGSNITEDGRLKYTMDKNGKPRDLVLVEQAKEILKKYRSSEVKSTDYIFPFLNNDENMPNI